MKQNRIGFFGGLDFVTAITAVLCSIYGLALVYSATHSSLSEEQIISSDVRSMAVSVAGGLIFAIIVSNIDYEIISKLWPLIAGGCVLLMIITFIFGVAPPSRPDAKSWLDLKIFYFQPSELLKVGFIISFSYHLDMVKEHINRVKTIVPLVIHGAIPVGLVLVTGDAGSALVFLVIFIGMLFFAKVNIGYFIAGICALMVGFVVAWQTGLINGIQRERITALFYPEQYTDALYQQTNAKIAMGGGGWTGQGYLKGAMTQSSDFTVPENQNDMILSVAGEEFGYIGALAVIFLLCILVVRVLTTGLKARDNVGYLMCSGISTMLFAQIFINVGMELSLLPCIGITLPLFSAGGSSSLCIYLALGIELSVYRFSKSQNKSLFYTE